MSVESSWLPLGTRITNEGPSLPPFCRFGWFPLGTWIANVGASLIDFACQVSKGP